MYSERYEIYIEEMTEDIGIAAKQLADNAEKDIPEMGCFPKMTIQFKDRSGKLDITNWQLAICSISKIDGGDENKRYLEVSGYLKGGYKIFCYNFCGTKSDCIKQLRNPSYIERIKQTIRVNLNAMDD